MPKLSTLLLFLSLGALPLLGEKGPLKAIMPEQHAEVFKTYCYDCHDGFSEEGNVNLEDIPFDMGKDIPTASLWQKILDAVNSGEMPPHDEKQISAEHKTAFLEDLSVQIVNARKILTDNGGVITMRRLNRREYSNTIESLLGVTPDVSNLPADEADHGFDTAGASLFFSPDQLEQYLASAKDSLELSFAGVRKVAPHKQRIEPEIEIRLAKEEQWLEVPKKMPNPILKAPEESMEGVEEMRMMFDIMFAAMQVDATRVLSYRMPVNSVISSLGAGITAHSMSHYSAGERRQVSEMRDRTNAKVLADFIDKLKASKEPNGTSLFDNSTITMGSNLRSVHSLGNCPTIVTGGGSGIKHGRHLVMRDKKTPLCNLWLSQLQGSGIDVKSHGDSTGNIPELFEA